VVLDHFVSPRQREPQGNKKEQIKTNLLKNPAFDLSHIYASNLRQQAMRGYAKACLAGKSLKFKQGQKHERYR
jgi:hypothetical protein